MVLGKWRKRVCDGGMRENEGIACGGGVRENEGIAGERKGGGMEGRTASGWG